MKYEILDRSAIDANLFALDFNEAAARRPIETAFAITICSQ